MKKRILFLSAGYWFSAYTLGLLLHPYKTARELVRRRLYSPLLLVPVVFWVLMWMVGMIGLRFGGLLLMLVGLYPAPQGTIQVLAFMFWWISTFLFMWQVVLGYLLLRFWEVLK